MRRVGQLDNRGSHFFLCKYWAQELSEQTSDAELAAKFTPLFETLSSNETVILDELNAVQGQPADIGGYYYSDPELREKVMRPSATFNKIVDAAIA